MTGLQRKTPLRRTSPTKRRRAAVCTFQRCSGRPVVDDICLRHAEAKADRLFSTFVRERDGRCTGATVFASDCSGPLQAAHIIGRRKQTTRYDQANVHALCRWHHGMVDQHTELGSKVRWAVSRLGEDGWSALIERSRITTPRLVAVTAALEWLGATE